MPKKVPHGEAERKIKELLGLPEFVNILQLQVYEKEYHSQRLGPRKYSYYRINYYDPSTKRVLRKHIKEKDPQRKGKILTLWRLEVKFRKGEPLGEFDRRLLKLLLSD